MNWKMYRLSENHYGSFLKTKQNKQTNKTSPTLEIKLLLLRRKDILNHKKIQQLYIQVNINFQSIWNKMLELKSWIYNSIIRIAEHNTPLSVTNKTTRKKIEESLESTQWLTVLDAHIENPGSIPNTRQLTIIRNSNSRGSIAFFWPPWVLGTHGIYTHTLRQNTHSHKIKTNKS